MIQKRAMAFAAVTSLLLAGAAANAAVVYGNFSTPKYNYVAVSEDATAPDVAPLFQAPTTINNTLHFTPSAFNAVSTNGGVDSTNATLSFGLNAKAGESIDRIAFQEFGDYFLFGGPSTGTTASVVSSPVFITVTSVNGATITPFTVSTTLSFVPNNGLYSLAPTGGVNAGTFQGLAVADLTGVLAGAGLSGRVTGVDVNLNNTLGAVSQLGTEARIQKKVFDVTPLSPGEPVPGPIVPEPSTLALLATALPAAMLRRRSR